MCDFIYSLDECLLTVPLALHQEQSADLDVFPGYQENQESYLKIRKIVRALKHKSWRKNFFYIDTSFSLWLVEKILHVQIGRRVRILHRQLTYNKKFFPISHTLNQELFGLSESLLCLIA